MSAATDGSEHRLKQVISTTFNNCSGVYALNETALRVMDLVCELNRLAPINNRKKAIKGIRWVPQMDAGVLCCCGVEGRIERALSALCCLKGTRAGAAARWVQGHSSGGCRVTAEG